jgi:hypothetical protein
MPCGVRVAQGKVPAAGLASSEVMSKSRSPRFPVTVTQPAVTRCRSGAGPVAAGQRKTGNGQCRDRRERCGPASPQQAAADPHAVPAATARKAISAMSRWMRPLPRSRGARRVIGEERQAARRGRLHRVRR